MNRNLAIFLVGGLIIVGLSWRIKYGRHMRRGNESRPEFSCRMILQEIYKKPFKSCRPDWLRNPETGACMELDCYNEELRLAVEYNGEQHYRFIEKFHKDEEAFKKQQKRDKKKKELCRKNGVKLIIIPHTVKDLRKFLYLKNGQTEKRV